MKTTQTRISGIVSTFKVECKAVINCQNSQSLLNLELKMITEAVTQTSTKINLWSVNDSSLGVSVFILIGLEERAPLN